MTRRPAEPRHRRCRSGRLLVAAVGVVLLGGCTQSVTGTPAAGSAGPAPPVTTSDAPAATAPAAPAGPACRVTIAAGSIRMSGGGRVRSVNNAHELACRGGPLVAVESIETGGVRFRIDAASVLVAADATEPVGPYLITVRELDPPAAEFDVAPAG